MSEPSHEAVVDTLLTRYGQTYAAEIGIDVTRDTPEELFGLLCASILFSARISAGLAVRAAQALRAQGWTSPQALVDAPWAERAEVLSDAGYARYNERTATMLGEAAQLLLDTYEGDLRQLREAAGRQPRRERSLLKDVKGLGDTGVSIFFREAQAAWGELYPFADKLALKTAAELGLGDEPRQLAALVDERDFPRLVAALVRAAKRTAEVWRAAAGEDVAGGEAGDDAGQRERGRSKAELYERARALDIPGRSGMGRAELAEAVAAREG